MISITKILGYDEVVFVSLGSACDIAAFLDELKLRKNSLPFDWLWNHCTGLDFVTQTLKNKFESLMNPNIYEISQHYRFPYPVVTYKEYSQIVHLHSNPLVKNKDHQTLVRRFKRLISEIDSNSFKQFIYYRKHSEDILAGLANNIEDSFGIIVNEASNFIELMLKEYPHIQTNFHLLLILQVEKEYLVTARLLEEKFKEKLRFKSLISIGTTIPRNADNQHELDLWSKQFRKILLQQKNIHFVIKLKVFFNSLYNYLRVLKLNMRIKLIQLFLRIANKLPFFE